MNILFTICARAGSKGVEGKNVRPLCGMPLVYYTTAAYEEYREKYSGSDSTSLAVNTDSRMLVEQIKKTGIEYLFVERKETLAGDGTAKKDVVKDTLEKTEKLSGIQYDIIVDLDLTSPLRTAEDIEGTIQVLLADTKADIAYSVTASRRSPYFNMVSQKEDGYYATVLASEYVARQQTPACYDMNASIYVYRREYLLNGLIHKRNARIWAMADTGILDIDSEEDLELMEVIAQYLFTGTSKYRYVLERIKKYNTLYP